MCSIRFEQWCDEVERRSFRLDESLMSPEEKLSCGISREEQEEDDNQVRDGSKVIMVLEVRKCRF